MNGRHYRLLLLRSAVRRAVCHDNAPALGGYEQCPVFYIRTLYFVDLASFICSLIMNCWLRYVCAVSV